MSSPTCGSWLAYKVETFDSERAVIVYARNPMEARRLGAEKLECHYEERECSVERTPEWDDGYDTRALLDAGWHWECGSCYRYCYGEDTHVVVRDDVAYCSACCCITELKRQRARREQEWRGIELVTRLAPGVEIRSLFLNVAGEVVAEVIRPENGHRTVERFVEET